MNLVLRHTYGTYLWIRVNFRLYIVFGSGLLNPDMYGSPGRAGTTLCRYC
jgi:hypothetical protein